MYYRRLKMHGAGLSASAAVYASRFRLKAHIVIGEGKNCVIAF